MELEFHISEQDISLANDISLLCWATTVGR